jgi:hypothetical protein
MNNKMTNKPFVENFRGFLYEKIALKESKHCFRCNYGERIRKRMLQTSAGRFF